MVFSQYLNDEDHIMYYGLGQPEPLIEDTVKEGNEESVVRKIEQSGQEGTKGAPKVYSSINIAASALRKSDSEFSKWLIFLSDTVDFSAGQAFEASQKGFAGFTLEKGKTELERLAKETDGELACVPGLNFVAIDASDVGQWNQQCKMWPTWKANVEMLSKHAQTRAQVSGSGMGLYVSAKSLTAIKEAFEKVASAMEDVGGVGE